MSRKTAQASDAKDVVKSTSGKSANARSDQGTRMKRAQTFTLAGVLVAVLASLAFDCGIGTPSAFGFGQFSLLCPLGGLEALLASKALVPVTLISLGVMVIFGLLFGRAWCSWGCPAPVIRRFFKRDPEPPGANLANAQPAKGAASCTSSATCGSSCDSSATCGSTGGSPATCGSSCGAASLATTVKGLAQDRRTWTLAAVLLATAIAGLPLFCLVCPIGLTFGTVGSLWHLIVDKQVTLSVLVFPAALAVELVLYRKWCTNLCPVAGLLNLFGAFARTFRPAVSSETCLRADGSRCHACASVCPEGIDLHAPDASSQLAVCTRCGECTRVCPTASIALRTLPPRADEPAASAVETGAILER